MSFKLLSIWFLYFSTPIPSILNILEYEAMIETVTHQTVISQFQLLELKHNSSRQDVHLSAINPSDNALPQLISIGEGSNNI